MSRPRSGHLERPVFFHPNEPSLERLRQMASLAEHCYLALTVGTATR